MRSRVRIGFHCFRASRSFLAGALTGVEGLIGSRQELFGTVAQLVLPPTCRKSDGKFEALPVHYQGAETPQDELQLLQSAFGKENEELVAAEANGKVRAADNSVEVSGKFLQHLVSSRMAVHVVDLLEIVQIQGEHSQGMSPALGARHLRGETLHSKTAIVQARQRINHGEIAQNFRMPMLFSELKAETFDQNLLIDGVYVENYHEDDQTE